jgi:hypothetical protein
VGWQAVSELDETTAAQCVLLQELARDWASCARWGVDKPAWVADSVNCAARAAAVSRAERVLRGVEDR